VQKWKLDDFATGLEAGLKGQRDLANGRRLFSETACIVCHNFQGEGGLGGPDLTSAGGRYSAVDLLDNILNPEKVINEQYGLLIYSMKNGKTITGRTVNMAGDTMMVATNPNDPGGSEVRFLKSELESIAPAKSSHMPAGLLDTLTREEVFDLLAYILRRP
jgi:putative heme-binding domain-containing protein